MMLWHETLPSVGTYLAYAGRSRIGSSDRVGGPGNMKSMWPPLAAIFFMIDFHRAGGHGPLAPSPPLLPLTPPHPPNPLLWSPLVGRHTPK